MIGKKSVRQETLSQQHSHAFLVIVLFFCESDVLGSLKFYKRACFVDQRAYLTVSLGISNPGTSELKNNFFPNYLERFPSISLDIRPSFQTQACMLFKTSKFQGTDDMGKTSSFSLCKADIFRTLKIISCLPLSLKSNMCPGIEIFVFCNHAVY